MSPSSWGQFLILKVDVESSNPTLLRVYEASRRHMLEESNLQSVRLYHGICVEVLRKRTKDLCRGLLSPDRILNAEPLEYVSGDAAYQIGAVISSSETWWSHQAFHRNWNISDSTPHCLTPVVKKCGRILSFWFSAFCTSCLLITEFRTDWDVTECRLRHCASSNQC